MTKTYRQGAAGAMMDEYERATGELTRIMESISDEEFERIRDTQTEDDDCRSIQTIMRHVIRAGYGYAGYMRDAWGMERGERWDKTVSRAETLQHLPAMLGYMTATLEVHWNISDKESNSLQMRTRWGVTYDFEQLFEHAIVHVLRHRRQIERFLGR